MPFRSAFQCLWCGRTHRARSPSDLEGWALLCPECLGRAGENPFLRFRLKQALADRSREGTLSPGAGSPPDDAHGGVAGDRADAEPGDARDRASVEPALNGRGDRASADPAANGHGEDRASAQPDGTTRDAADAAAGQADPD